MKNSRRLFLACNNALESLEHRQLLSAATPLPLRLDFDGSIDGTILDKQGRGTGYTSIQVNSKQDQYQSGLIDLDTANGVLRLTTRGSATSGSASGLDNSLANGLQSTFNGYQRGFSVDTRLLGPLTNLKDRFEQAGIFFGADQDNYVKLVAGRNFDGQYLAFEDEFSNATGGVSSTRNGSNSETNIGNFASINTLDLRIVGDASTGKLSAYFRVNSDTGAFTKVGYDVTIAAEKRSVFFNGASNAGIVAIGKSDTGPVTATFDSFGITAGSPILARPSVARIEGIDGTTLNVRRDAAIKAILSLSNGSSPVDAATLSGVTVKLYRAGDSAIVDASIDVADRGAGIVVTPSTLLDPNTSYTVEITSGLKDQAGAAFQPFIASFTTGTMSGGSDLSAAGPQASFSVNALYFSDITANATGGSGTSLTQTIRITNTGVANLVLGSNALSFGGTNGGEFHLGGTFALPTTIEPGAFRDVPVVFQANAVGLRSGTLTITTNDPTLSAKSITLRGLGTAGAGGSLEPSLQRILDLYQIPVIAGDPTPDTTDYPAPPTSGESIDIQKLIKAGSGPVTIEVLANFANTVSPSSRFGYYTPGNVADRSQLFTVGSSSSQTARPVTSSALSFTPTGEFGLYAEFPAFVGRVVTSERSLNTWETNPARQQKVRFFPLKNPDGTLVPNAYIFTFEEYNQSFDQNDLVGIIRNVNAVPSGPELGFINLDGVPFSDRLVMSRIRDIQVQDDVNHYIPNTFHDQSTLRVTNTGTQTLDVSGVTLSNGDFTILSGGGSFSLSPGATRDIVVKFVFNRTGVGDDVRSATLTLTSNDSDESSKVFKLSGLWQSYSENAPNGVSQEPTVATVLAALGYTINAGTLNTHGAISRAGEEILSEMWQSADTSRTVTARQLAAYHQQKSTTNSRIRYLLNGASGVGTTIFAHEASDGQTLLPHLYGSTTAPAYGEFQPGSTTFSWTVDSDQSINSRNTNAYSPGAFPAIDGGHALRFYAAKDTAGKLIPNTFILLMDYVGQSFSNFDYQDNIYILTNVKPVSGPLAPSGVTASTSGQGNFLDWNTNPEGNLGGYNVYRSNGGGAYAKINPALITGSSYTDAGALVGTNYSYQIRPVDVNGTEGSAASVSITRTSDTVAPATPFYPTAQGQTGGVALNWLDNIEADLAGYNVYRSTDVNGTYTKLNSSPLTSSDYFDLSAPGATTSYYRVTAIDVAGNESQAATMNAYRPASGNVPAAPTSLVATSATSNSISLSWTDNASDETGFIVERQNADGTFSQIGTTSANVTTYFASGLAGGTSYVFRVRANNNAGPSGFSNQINASTTQSAPAAATNLAALALGANAVKLTWTDNAANETGYRIERRLGANGAWVAIDSIGANVTLYVDQSAVAATTYNYQVIATNAVGSSPASNVVTVTTPSADGYTSVDIGSPMTAGSTTILNAGKDYDIVAGGTDIWGASDQFRYVYKSITGNFDYSARITDVSVGDVGSMAGLMARETLAADSRHIYSRVRAGADIRGNYRLTTGGASNGVGGGPAAAFPNVYVRLQRVGNVFTTFGSADGTNWSVVTQQTINMASTIFFGIAVSARTTTAATTTAKVRELTDRLASVSPNAPTDLVGSADASAPSVSLAWSDSATNEAGYRIERRIAGSATWSTVNNLAANSTSYLDTSVAINTEYVYRVFATNAAGDSAPSGELSVSVANGVPAAPSNIAASNVAGGIKLVWTDNSSNESNFQVERRLANGSWASLAIVNANVTTYTDAALTGGASYVYRVRALSNVADSAYSDEVTISAPAALSFTSVDIGGATGGATQVITDGSDYNVTASGTDVWNASDQFRFVYRQITGNFDIRVRIAGINFTSDQSMAGLMARATLDANSRNVFVKARADGTDRMTYRSSTGGTTTGVGSGTSTFPNGYLRLTRVGNVFTGYASVDGVSWTTVSTVTMSLPTSIYLGMAAASHVTGATTTAQFRDLTLA